MIRQLGIIAVGACLALAYCGRADAQVRIGAVTPTMPNVTANSNANTSAYRTALSRTPKTGIQVIRGNGATTNVGLSSLTTGVNSLMMMNGMIPGSPYLNQGYNPYMYQGYNPYMYQGYNPYMYQGYNPYMYPGMYR